MKKCILVCAACLTMLLICGCSKPEYSAADYYTGSEFLKLETVVSIEDYNITPLSGCTAGYTFHNDSEALEKFEEYQAYLDEHFEGEYDPKYELWYYMDSEDHEMIIKCGGDRISIIINTSMSKLHENYLEEKSKN